MKKWERAEINCIEISATEHQFRFNCQLDGGYLGDGKISGWFGPDPKPCTPTPTPTPAVDPTPAPVPEKDTVDQLS